MPFEPQRPRTPHFPKDIFPHQPLFMSNGAVNLAYCPIYYRWAELFHSITSNHPNTLPTALCSRLASRRTRTALGTVAAGAATFVAISSTARKGPPPHAIAVHRSRYAYRSGAP